MTLPKRYVAVVPAVLLTLAPLSLTQPYHSAPFAVQPPTQASTAASIAVEVVEPSPTPTPTPKPTAEPTPAPPTPIAAPVAGFDPFAPRPRNGGGDDWDVLLQAYFGNNWQRAKAIMHCESGGNSLSIGDKSLTYVVGGVTYGFSVGLFQIRFLPGRPSPEQLLDPEFNIATAARMSGGGVNWSPWSCSRKV